MVATIYRFVSGPFFYADIQILRTHLNFIEMCIITAKDDITVGTLYDELKVFRQMKTIFL
jgi:hypothetical protein